MRTKNVARGAILLAVACASANACFSGAREDVAPAGFLAGAEGARLHYLVVGEGPDTVVVVHGGPGAGMNSVRPDFEPLAEELTLVFFDQRGGGHSELPADTSRLRARFFIEDLDSVRAYFGLERMNILAHSFGSVLIARYAQEHPDRIHRIVLHGATGPVRERAAQLARRAPHSPDSTLSRRAGELLGSLLEGTASDPAATCREWEALNRQMASARGEPTRWRGSSCDAPSEAVGYYFRYTAQLAPRTFGDWDFTEGLEHVPAPVLVVYSADDDSLAVAEQRAWAGAFPDGRLLLVPGADKGAIAERPDVIVPAVVEFFTIPEAATAGLPRFDFTDSGGCGDVFVFKANADGSEFLTVSADAKQLGIEKGRERTFAIDRTLAGLDVRVDVYSQAPISPEYCNDFVSEEKPIARWTAVAGQVSITLRDGGGGPAGTYEAIVVLEDAVFEDGTARRFEQRDPIEITAVVGWLAG